MALNLDGERLIRFQPPRLSKVDFCNHCLERKLESFRMKWRGSLPQDFSEENFKYFANQVSNQAGTMKFYTHDISMKILKSH